MDSGIQLALISKAKKVFGTDGTFLSFPVFPLPFTRQQLDLFAQHDSDAATVVRSLHNLQAFSTLVNIIPEDEVWLPMETRFLWDVYEGMLNDADVASSSRTPAEEVEYQEAIAFLRQPGEDGRWVESAAVRAYRQHKDAFLSAEQAYQAAKSTAECATDTAEQQQWNAIDEPKLRAQLEDLNEKWIVEGYKYEVLDAQSKVVLLGARLPRQTWAEWQSRFNPDIDAITGTDNSSFFPSFFSPSNALDPGAWKPFKLTQQEIQVLLNEAPAELRDRLAVGSAATSVASITFEFSFATISRPWFASEAFPSRFWRFTDTSRIVSDGSTPPKGACGAYVTAVVFVRRVVVEKQTESAGSVPKIFDGFDFEIVFKELYRHPRIPTILVPGQQYPGHITRIIFPKMEPIFVVPPFAVDTAVESGGPMRRDSLRDAPDARGDSITAAEVSMRSLYSYRAEDFNRLLTVPTLDTLTLVTPPPPVHSLEPSVQDEPIYILAFICKALPICPNPDLKLQWES